MTPAERLMVGGDHLGRTDALLIRQGGRTIAEHYGDGVDHDIPLRSWPMAKGMLHAAVGIAVGRGLLDPEWVRTATVATGTDEEGRTHSAHWWLWDANPWGAFNCSGYEGQYVVVVPALDAVVVGLGSSDASVRDNVVAELTAVIAELGE